MRSAGLSSLGLTPQASGGQKRRQLLASQGQVTPGGQRDAPLPKGSPAQARGGRAAAGRKRPAELRAPVEAKPAGQAPDLRAQDRAGPEEEISVPEGEPGTVGKKRQSLQAGSGMAGAVGKAQEVARAAGVEASRTEELEM